MKVNATWLLMVAILALLPLGGPTSAGAAAPLWQPGRVLAAELSGHGPSTSSQSKGGRKGDVWWTYCVSSEVESYSVVSRGSPPKLGLEVSSPVRFSVAKNRMTVINSRKERHVLRILRQDSQGTCR